MAVIKILTWGWKEEFNETALNELLKEVFDGKHCPFVRYIDTQDDVNALAIASQEITQDEAQQAWEDLWKEMEARVTERELIVLAAAFAQANMVASMPTRDDVKRLINANYTVTISDAVRAFCEQFYEGDGELFDMYVAQAELWLQDLKEDGRAYRRITKMHPDMAALVW